MAKCLYKTNYLSLMESDKGFFYGERKGIDSSATLCYQKRADGYYFLIRYQLLPIRSEANISNKLYACCITGSIEPNETFESNIIKEVAEESGFVINQSLIVASNIYVATTQMNENVKTFIVDITNSSQKEFHGDGSYFESISENRWLSAKQLEAIIYDNSEPYLVNLYIAYDLFKRKVLGR